MLKSVVTNNMCRPVATPAHVRKVTLTLAISSHPSHRRVGQVAVSRIVADVRHLTAFEYADDPLQLAQAMAVNLDCEPACTNSNSAVASSSKGPVHWAKRTLKEAAVRFLKRR